MTTSRNKRAWSIDGILHRYFQSRDDGPPSCTMAIDDIKTDNPERPPRWLVRLCDVGIAIEKLPEDQRKAVRCRWETAIKLEGAECRVLSLDIRACKERRAGEDWKSTIRKMREVEDETHELWKTRRRMEQRRAYLCGMDALENIFSLKVSHEV